MHDPGRESPARPLADLHGPTGPMPATDVGIEAVRLAALPTVVTRLSDSGYTVIFDAVLHNGVYRNSPKHAEAGRRRYLGCPSQASGMLALHIRTESSTVITPFQALTRPVLRALKAAGWYARCSCRASQAHRRLPAYARTPRHTSGRLVSQVDEATAPPLIHPL